MSPPIFFLEHPKNQVIVFQTAPPLSYDFSIFTALCLSHPCVKFIFLFLFPLSTIKAHPKVHLISPKSDRFPECFTFLYEISKHLYWVCFVIFLLISQQSCQNVSHLYETDKMYVICYYYLWKIKLHIIVRYPILNCSDLIWTPLFSYSGPLLSHFYSWPLLLLLSDNTDGWPCTNW